MPVVALVVVEHKTVKIELIAVLWSHLPVKKCSEGEPLHQAVEESVDLLWAPDELSLNCGKHEFVSVDLVKSLRNCVAGLVHRA